MQKLKWSGKGAIPAIDEKVTVTINSLGDGWVKGYFADEGYIGVTVNLDSPPDWYVKQNEGNVPALVFGAEIKAVDFHEFHRKRMEADARRELAAERKKYEEQVSGPGKFELCAIYVPYYYDMYLDGGVDEELDDNKMGFNVTEEDRKLFPELKEALTVVLVEDDNGFIHEV